MMDGLGRALGESDRANREEFAAQLLSKLIMRFQWTSEEISAISDLLAKVSNHSYHCCIDAVLELIKDSEYK